MSKALETTGRVAWVIVKLFGLIAFYIAVLVYFMEYTGMSSITATLLVNLLGAGVLLGYMKLLKKVREKDGTAKLERNVTNSLQPFEIGAIWIISFFAGQIASQSVILHYPNSGIEQYAKNFNNADVISVIMLVLVAAPVFEELVFRYWFCGNMVRAGSPIAVIIIVQSLLFALAHGTLPHLLSATLMGFVQCLLYFKTKNLDLLIVSHMAYNGFVLFFAPYVQKIAAFDSTGITTFCLFGLWFGFVGFRIWQSTDWVEQKNYLQPEAEGNLRGALQGEIRRDPF